MNLSSKHPQVAGERPFQLGGEVALITGGAKGLGLGIGRAFIAAGRNVVLVGVLPSMISVGRRVPSLGLPRMTFALGYLKAALQAC